MSIIYSKQNHEDAWYVLSSPRFSGDNFGEKIFGLIFTVGTCHLDVFQLASGSSHRHYWHAVLRNSNVLAITCNLFLGFSLLITNLELSD